MTTKELLNKHRDMMAACDYELATNFDCPSKRIIGVWCSRMGITWDQYRAMVAEKFKADPLR